MYLLYLLSSLFPQAVAKALSRPGPSADTEAKLREISISPTGSEPTAISFASSIWWRLSHRCRHHRVRLTQILDKFGRASAIDASIMAFGLRKFFGRGGCRCRGRWGRLCPRVGPSGCSSYRPAGAASARPPPRRCLSWSPRASAGPCR